MKLPRDLSGEDLASALSNAGYSVTRRKGSHMRLSTMRNGEHHVTVPDHDSVKIGTLARILRDVADHLGVDRDRLLEEMFP